VDAGAAARRDPRAAPESSCLKKTAPRLRGGGWIIANCEACPARRFPHSDFQAALQRRSGASETSADAIRSIYRLRKSAESL
jgi:hypothetical protein